MGVTPGGQEHSDAFSLARDNSRKLRIAAQRWIVLTARHLDLKTGGAELLRAIRAHTRALPASETRREAG